MSIINNTWIEKIKKKKRPETAPAYEFDSKDTWIPASNDKPIKRFTSAARATLVCTLRGIRK